MGSSVNYGRLDELDLAADPRTVWAGFGDGVHWAIRAESDGVGVLRTVVTYISGGVSATFSVLGASLHNGQLLSLWVGRERDARPFLLLRTAPVVTHATAVLACGHRHEVALSPVIEDFRLRFGGVPLREDDPLASVELAGPDGGPQVIELWRPPRLVSPRLVPPARVPAALDQLSPVPAGPDQFPSTRN
jgi:hypothetical protein